MYEFFLFHVLEEGHMAGQNKYKVIVYITNFNILVCTMLVLLLHIID